MKLLFLFLITQLCCVFTAVILNGECTNPCIKQRTCQVDKISGKCYYVFKDREGSWSENKDLCSANNLTMVQITKEDIKDGLSLPNDLTDQEYVWLGGRANDLPSWMFSNGVLLDQTHFNKPPDFQDGQELDHCGTVTDGLINNKTDCRNKNHFICRFDDWQSFPNIYLSEASVTWFEARARCNDMGGDIFFLYLNEDGRFLEYKLDPSKQRTFFIGLSTIYWQWENTEQIRHFNWISGEPNELSEKCLAMYAKDAFWVDRDCNLKMHGLCQGAPTIILPTRMPPPELEGNENAGLKAALAIFILSTIGLIAAVIFMKRDRLLLEYRKLRQQPIDANTLTDKQEAEEIKLLSADEGKSKEEIKKQQSTVEQKNQQTNKLQTTVEQKDQQTNKLQSTVEQKDQQINELQSTVEQKDQQINELQCTVEQKNQQINELQSTVEQKDQHINKLDRQVILLTEEKKHQFQKLKGKTDQQLKWLQNENDQLEEELKREIKKMDEAVTKLQTEKYEQIEIKKRDQEAESKSKIKAIQLEIETLDSQKDIHIQKMKEELKEKGKTIKETFDQKIETLKKNEKEMEKKDYKKELHKLENEKKNQIDEIERGKKKIKTKEYWDQYVNEKKSGTEKEIRELHEVHAAQIKSLEEKYEESIKQIKEQHYLRKKNIEIRIKENKQQIEILENELGKNNEISKSVDV